GAVPLDEVDGALAAEDKVALLFGAEGPGLSPATLAAADVRAGIPMRAGGDSLNVGVAAGIAFWVLGRRRARAAGGVVEYDGCQPWPRTTEVPGSSSSCSSARSGWRTARPRRRPPRLRRRAASSRRPRTPTAAPTATAAATPAAPPPRSTRPRAATSSP